MWRPNHSKLNTREVVRGFTLLEIMVVLTVTLVISAIAIAQFMRILYNSQLRASAAEFADMTQQARMNAARANATYPIRFQMNGGLQQAYIDLNNNSSLDANEPLIDFPKYITGAAGAPNGSGGQPSAYTLVGDTTSGTPFDNSNVIAYSPRGLPCDYTSSTCATPATSYFVFYFKDSRGGGWSAVLVTKSGRSKVLMWNGGSWK
jgi:prepilin-type N-terminal cleavage/methylation domain-containing protein